MLYKPGKSSAKVASSGSHHGHGKLKKQHQIKPQEDLLPQPQSQHHTVWSRLFSAISHLSLFSSHQNVTSALEKTTNVKEGELNQQQPEQQQQLEQQQLEQQQQQQQQRHQKQYKLKKGRKNQRPSVAASCHNLTSPTELNSGNIADNAPLGSTFSMDDEDEQPSAVNRVAKWATGLSHLLSDPSGVSIFTEFLRGEFSDENINFWLLVEEFKALEEPDEILSCARRICRLHIDCDGPASVNLDCATVRELQYRLRPDQPSPPKRSLFDTAQEHIFSLMRLDSYPRFLKSALYKDCLLCELESRPLPAPPSIRCSEISLLPEPTLQQQQLGGKGRRKSRDMRLLQPEPAAAYRRNRQPSLIVAALDLDSSKC